MMPQGRGGLLREVPEKERWVRPWDRQDRAEPWGNRARLSFVGCGALGKNCLSLPLCKMGMMKIPLAPPPLRVVLRLKGVSNQWGLELSLAGWALYSCFMDKSE